VHAVRGDLRQIPFADGRFDGDTSFDGGIYQLVPRR
jgi:hypothetical protein